MRRARRIPGLYRGGAAPPNPPVFLSGIFGGAVLGPFWVDVGARMCRIGRLLDDYVNLSGGLRGSIRRGLGARSAPQRGQPPFRRWLFNGVTRDG